MNNPNELPQPADGFKYPVTMDQQLRRANRIAHVLWSNREALAVGDDRVDVSVEPAATTMEQIVFHVHGSQRIAAEALCERIGISSEDPEMVSGEDDATHYRWYGMLGGFRVRVALLEKVLAETSAVTTEEEAQANAALVGAEL